MGNDTEIAELRSLFPFIGEIGQAKWEELQQQLKIARFPEGTILLKEGHTCQNANFILEGSIRVYKLSPEGKEVTLYRIGRGDTCVLILSCLMGSTEYPAIAQVEEPVTLMTLPADYFKAMFHQSPSWQEFVFKTLSRRLSEVMLVVEEIAFKSMDRRLAAFLYDKQEASKPYIEITHEEIALELGTAREVVSRVLKELEKKGFVSLSRGKIHIKDIPGLKKLL